MGQWTDRVREHVVFENLLSLGPLLDNALEHEAIDAAGIEAVERVRAVLTFAGKRLAGADPLLVHEAPLDGIAGAAQNISAELRAFQDEGLVEYLANAAQQADVILTHLANIAYPFVADDWISIRDAAVSYRDSVEKHSERLHRTVAGVQTSADALDTRLKELASAVEEENTRLAAVTADFNTRYTTAEEARTQEAAAKIQAALSQLGTEAAAVQQKLSELATEIVNERSRLATVATEFQSQFSAAQELRSREFSEGQNNRQEKFTTLFTEYTQKLSEHNAEFAREREVAVQKHDAALADLHQQFAANAKAVLDQIDEHKRDVEKLVGVIGNLGVTSGYQKVANYARMSTIVWQAVAVLSMVVVIVFAFNVFLPLLQNQQHTGFDWHQFASRLVIMIPVGVLAAYAAHQGDKYQEMERRNRRLALELEAVGPYLAPLPVDKQEAFRLQLGERTFGRDDTELLSRRKLRKQNDKSPATSVDLANQIQEMVRVAVAEAIKAVRPGG
jgi:hypothetical protein